MWTVLGTIGVVLAAIAAGVLVDRKLGLLPRPRELRAAGEPGLKLPPHEPGDAAETALAAPPRRIRCRACGAAAELAEESHARYGDRDLRVQRYCCTRCAAARTVYIA
jgi:hypothetical protein